jgi:uncharacterized protein YjlB
MQIDHFRPAPSGDMPNHPSFPVLLYRGAVAATGPEAFEELFARNGWPPQWRDGIYDCDHFHTEGHEALGVAAGEARVRLGGPAGRDLDFRTGDVVVLPAGTGHRRLAASRDFLVVGAYPPGQTGDIRRGPPTPEMLARIARLPAPADDPAAGAGGPLARLWRRD